MKKKIQFITLCGLIILALSGCNGSESMEKDASTEYKLEMAGTFSPDYDATSKEENVNCNP